MTEARNYRGFDPDRVAGKRGRSFWQLPGLRGVCRHARSDHVLAHVHDAAIEISEGPEPPSRDGPLLCQGALAGPTLASLWRFRLCARVSSDPQHLLLIGLPVLR